MQSNVKPFASSFSAGLLGAVLALAGASNAAGPGGERSVDMSAYQTKAEMQTALAIIQAAIPKPATAIPPMEMPGGTVGTAGTYRPADARQPRITRSKSLVLASDGTATFDWTAQGALAQPVQVTLTPVYAGTGVPKCWATAVTATSASVRCVIENVALVSVAGVANIGSVTNSAPAGLTVGIIALPPS